MTEDTRAETSSAYDQVVDDFVRRNAGTPAEFAEFRASFVAQVRAGGRVADFGCGPGRDAAQFVAAGLEVVAVDASRQMTLHARSVGVPVVQADIRFVPVCRASVDGIWAAASLLHVPRVEVPATLRQWWGCLRSAGVLGLSTSLGDKEGWETCPYTPSTQPTIAPLRRWFVHHDKARLFELLDVAGFAMVSSREHVTHRRWLQVLARRRDH